MKSDTKFGILSDSLPPSTTGQAIMLYRLLKDVDPQKFFLMSKEKYHKPEEINSSLWLPVQYHWSGYSQERPFPKSNVVKMLLHVLTLTWHATIRVIKICNIIRIEKCFLLVACSGTIFDIFGGFIASKITGIQFIAYNFDYYVYEWASKKRRFFLKLITPLVFKASDAVIVPNEYLRNEYQLHYKINPLVIHNPIDDFPPLEVTPWPYSPDAIKIVYTGSIYDAHYDAFHNLVAALKLMNKPEIRLHLYTPQTRDVLADHGLIGDFVIHTPISAENIFKIQRQADILFLGMAFNSPYPEIIRTSAPGKMGEYLASGRPILVHSPVDSYISWYFNEYQCGIVVDRPDPVLIAQAILQIINDQESREKRCSSSLVRAKTDFNKEVASSQFIRLIG